MRAADLTPEQLAELSAQLARKLRYFDRLTARMALLKFPPDDRLFQAACAAKHAVQDLHTAARIAGVRHGQGLDPFANKDPGRA